MKGNYPRSEARAFKAVKTGQTKTHRRSFRTIRLLFLTIQSEQQQPRRAG